VGIGTTAIQSNQLMVYGGNSISGISLGDFNTTGSGVKYIGITAPTNGTLVSTNSGFSGITFGGPNDAGGTSGYLAFHTHGFGLGSAERMRIDKSGNVGIGTATPTSVLTVHNGGAYQSHHLIIRGQEFYASGNSSTGIAINAGVNRSGNKQLWFMDPDLAINTTNAALRVLLGSTGTGISGISTDGTTTVPLSLFGSSITMNTLGTGTVYSSGGTLTNTNPSDPSLKKNIAPLPDVDIEQLNPIQFNWIDTETHGSTLQFGFLASEIQALYPNLVSTWKDKDGNEKLGYDTVGLIPILTKMIQQQQKTIASLIARLDAAGI